MPRTEFPHHTGIGWGDMLKWWTETSSAVLKFPVDPQRRYSSLGWPHDLRIPLVAPDDVPPETPFVDIIARFIDPGMLLDAPLRLWFNVDLSRESASRRLPDSLLARLLLHALFVTAAEVRRAAQGIAGPSLEPVASDQTQWTELAQHAVLMDQQDLGVGGPVVELYHGVRKAIAVLLDQPVGMLDRIMRATLDTAAYRIDPFVTAYAWRRLQHAPADTHAYQLGIYGWIDAPKPGAPGPTDGGLLHAPSEQQAMAAVILRDKAINDPEPSRWDMNLESSTIRLAEQIAEEVRLGAHIGEVLGRYVERIAGKKSTIEALRTQFPLRTEHAGRRTCNGEAILKANPAALTMLTADQIIALDPLRRALDTYGDLLVAEAVYHVVAGRGEVAGAAMDAATGLAGAPNLEVIQTQRTGRSVNTNVVVALPTAANPAEAFDASPGEIAEPSVAQFLIDTVGQPDTAAWSWEVLEPDLTTTTILLADLDLQPVDAVVLSEEELARLVLAAVSDGSVLNTRWPLTKPDGTSTTVQFVDLALLPDEIVRLSEDELLRLVRATGPEGSVVGEPEAPAGLRAQRRARRIIDVLGSQPAVPADLIGTGEQRSDEAIRTELIARYERLHNVAALAIAELLAASSSADEIRQQDAMRLAARWGITPAVQVEDTLAERVERAHEALTDRRDRAPGVADIATFSAQQLAAAIAELAAPEGQLAVLSRIDLLDWPTTFADEPTLDAEWLTINAEVRTPLARLEAYQLDGMLDGLWSPFAAWTNLPGDPWQVNIPVDASGRPPGSRLIALYGPANVLPAAGATNTAVACGLLDSWGETIPDVEQATSAAFGFNAPAARAPQAILLAVPPVPGEPLTTEVITEIVAETRELAHARMATPADLHAFDSALPLMMLPASGVTAVELEPQH